MIYLHATRTLLLKKHLSILYIQSLSRTPSILVNIGAVSLNFRAGYYHVIGIDTQLNSVSLRQRTSKIPQTRCTRTLSNL